MATDARPTHEVTGWPELLDALEREYVTSVERTVEHMRRLSSYDELPADALREAVRRNHDAILAGLRTRRPPEPSDDVLIFGDTGARRARQAVTVSDMLAAWRMGQESLYLLAVGLVAPGPWRDALLREFLELEVRWVDFAMLAAAEGHRRAELRLAREQQHALANLIRRLMSGAAAPAELRAAFLPLGLDPDTTYHAVCARPDGFADSSEIEHFLGVDVPAARGSGIAAVVDGDVCAVVGRLPSSPAPVAIGASEAVGLHGLELAFRHAARALRTATTLGVKGVFDLETLGAQVAVVDDTDVGDAMVRRYVAELEGTPGGVVVLDTVQCFLDNDLSTETTAHELGVHVNTIRQRLARFEEATGGSLRETEAIVEVWWALRRRRLR
jgi:hypothetical protein